LLAQAERRPGIADQLAFDGSDDFVGIGGPHEGLGVIVGFLREAVDGCLEIDDRAEDPAFEVSVGFFC